MARGAVSAARMIISEVPRLRVLVAAREKLVDGRETAGLTKYAPGAHWVVKSLLSFAPFFN